MIDLAGSEAFDYNLARGELRGINAVRAVKGFERSCSALPPSLRTAPLLTADRTSRLPPLTLPPEFKRRLPHRAWWRWVEC